MSNSKRPDSKMRLSLSLALLVLASAANAAEAETGFLFDALHGKTPYHASWEKLMKLVQPTPDWLVQFNKNFDGVAGQMTSVTIDGKAYQISFVASRRSAGITSSSCCSTQVASTPMARWRQGQRAGLLRFPDASRARRDDEGGEGLSGTRQFSSSANGCPSKQSCPRPISAIASFMRPDRPSALSASATRRAFGEAVGEAARNARAMANSSRSGASAQAAI